MKATAILAAGVVLTLGTLAEAASSESRPAPQILGRRMMRNFEAELAEAFKNMFNFGSSGALHAAGEANYSHGASAEPVLAGRQYPATHDADHPDRSPTRSAATARFLSAMTCP